MELAFIEDSTGIQFVRTVNRNIQLEIGDYIGFFLDNSFVKFPIVRVTNNYSYINVNDELIKFPRIYRYNFNNYPNKQNKFEFSNSRNYSIYKPITENFGT